MAQKNKKKGDMQKIASGALSRGLSLLNLTISSGARFASLKITDTFHDKEQRQDRFEKFLGEQAGILADELGKLKGSIMKAGQMLSVYGEHFLPKEVNKVLKTLQSDSQPIIWEEMEKVLNTSLGKDVLSNLEIDKTPIAAASMGQVYKAYCKKRKRNIALKIQYPGVDKAIDSDLKALKSVLQLSRLVPTSLSFDEIFKEIRMMLHYEVDYAREFQTILEYTHLLKDDPRYYIPEVFSEYSSKRVLAMELIEGLAIDSDEVLNLSQKRRNILAASAMDLMFKEIFEWRMVQTDPHFGNYLILLDQSKEPYPDRLVLLDFGAVRKFPKKYITPFANMVQASMLGETDSLIQYAIKLGFIRDDDPEEAIELFQKICQVAIEAFHEKHASPSIDGTEEGDNPYHWKDSDLIKRLSVLAKNALFSFKLRTPPREAVFLDRKMVGTYVILSTLGMKLGPRALIQKYLDQAT